MLTPVPVALAVNWPSKGRFRWSMRSRVQGTQPGAPAAFVAFLGTVLLYPAGGLGTGRCRTCTTDVPTTPASPSP